AARPPAPSARRPTGASRSAESSPGRPAPQPVLRGWASQRCLSPTPCARAATDDESHGYRPMNDTEIRFATPARTVQATTNALVWMLARPPYRWTCVELDRCPECM